MSDAIQTDALRQQTRRHFLADCGLGLGRIGLASLMGAVGSRPVCGTSELTDPLAPRPPHHPPRARNVIFLFMAGGPSQLEMLDHKPRLNALHGSPIPASFIEGRRFAFMDSFFQDSRTLLGNRYTFRRAGQSGKWFSELLPHTAGMADELSFLMTCRTDVFNHAPAKVFMNTGTARFGRPSMGAWVTYGLGSESRDLPGFVVLQSGIRGPRGGAVNWASGFLPSVHQGVPFLRRGHPVPNLGNPAGVSRTRQGAVVNAVRDLNLAHHVRRGDPEILTRIASYEKAYRMQSAVPELLDLQGESRRTLESYGISTTAKPSFARNCLMARRLVERGVRFVQLYHTNWDSHGGKGENLQKDLAARCRETDGACAALIRDLKARGLLEDTLVVWGGEFGRTPMGEARDTTGRNHHIEAFPMWFAGGGTAPGTVLGQTDELGFGPVDDSFHVHDIHATLLHLLGLDHLRLTVRFQGLDMRLTDVSGKVIHGLVG